jgi:5-methylcytosine-specific restriction endonuclease McrA
MATITCKECGKIIITTSNRQMYCKECIKLHKKKYQKEYQEKNRKHINKQMYEWKLKNPIKFKKIQQKYRDTHIEKEKVRFQKYKQSYRGKQIQLKINLNRASRIHNIKHVFTIDEWKQKVESTNGICPICKKYVGIENMTLDHIIPISKAKKGQIYTIDDVSPMCGKCNSKKSNNI